MGSSSYCGLDDRMQGEFGKDSQSYPRLLHLVAVRVTKNAAEVSVHVAIPGYAGESAFDTGL